MPLYEVQRNLLDIPAIFFKTVNNRPNVFDQHSQTIEANLAAGLNPLEGLPEELKKIGLENIIDETVKEIGDKVKLKKSIVGKSAVFKEESETMQCLILDDVEVHEKWIFNKNETD